MGMKKVRRIDGQYKPVSDLCPVDNLPSTAIPGVPAAVFWWAKGI